MIDAVNQIWRPAYEVETNESVKTALYGQLIGATGIRDSLYFLLLYCFGVGAILFGIVFVQKDKLGAWIGASFLFFGVLSFVSFIRYYARAETLSAFVDWQYTWIYPWMQPATRIALGVWLWKAATIYETQTKAV